MEFSVNGNELAVGLSLVSRVIPTRAARPVLSNVCLSAANGDGSTLEVLGTDMEIGVRYRVHGANVTGSGDALLPAKRLTAIVRNLGKSDIQFSNGDLDVEMRTDRKRFKLVGEEPSDFPVVATMPAKGTFQIDGDTLLDLFSRTAFATAAEETRYAIHGVLLEVGKGEVRMTATCGKRLSSATGKADSSIQGVSALVPPRAFTALFSTFPKGRKRNPVPVGPVTVSVEERRIILSYGPIVVVASKIEGTFPAYEEVIPKRTANGVNVAVADLADGLKDVALMASEGSHAVAVGFRPGGITLGAKASNVGDCSVEIDAGTSIGQPVEIHFNPKYLLDFLKVCGSEEISILFNDARSAVKLTPCGNASKLVPSGDVDHVYVVMPVTLDS